MTLKEYFKKIGAHGKKEFAQAIHYDMDYLRQVAGGHATASPKLAKLIEEKSNHMVKKESLRPDIFGE